MIQFQQVSKAYRGGQQALQKVSFHLPKGDMAFLTGHSGAGKSTLLKLLCAIERPSDGQILFNGHDIGQISLKRDPFPASSYRCDFSRSQAFDGPQRFRQRGFAAAY